MRNNKEHAKYWDTKMRNDYEKEIKYSIDHSVIYPDKDNVSLTPDLYHKPFMFSEDFNTIHSETITKTISASTAENGMGNGYNTKSDTTEKVSDDTGANNTIKICLEDLDTTSAVFKAKGKKIAVLNFASYYCPGGGFMQGCTAQEETICAESTLYQVLSARADYYEHRNKQSNSNNMISKDDAYNESLYGSDILYTPDIVFVRGDEEKKVDVITCAAPNAREFIEQETSGSFYYTWHYVEATIIPILDRYILSRIKHILLAANANNIDTLILGAWGCGAFGNQPKSVAKAFKESIDAYAGNMTIENYLFAIPKEDDEDLQMSERRNYTDCTNVKKKI